MPRVQGDNKLKAHPCGNDHENDWTATFTQLQFGVNALTFTETIKHSKSPYRIALTHTSDSYYDTFVLLDQIPHNDAGKSDDDYRIYLSLPDVDCSTQAKHCALQVIQVMTDKFSGVCSPSQLANSCGSSSYVYFSCTNVLINGTGAFPSSLYASVDCATSAQGWTKTSSNSWCKAPDGYWELYGYQASTPACSAPAPTPAPPSSPTPPTPSSPTPATYSAAATHRPLATATIFLITSFVYYY